MKLLWKWMRRMLTAVVLLALAGIVVSCIRDRPLTPAQDYAFGKPSFENLPRTSVCWIEFDQNVVPGKFATAGVTEMKKWEITASGLLIKHPKGTILVDTGNSSHFQDEIAG